MDFICRSCPKGCILEASNPNVTKCLEGKNIIPLWAEYEVKSIQDIIEIYEL